MGAIWCCKDCKDRHVGCHSVCEKYKEQKEKAKEIDDKAKKDNLFGGSLRSDRLWNHTSVALRHKSHKR